MKRILVCTEASFLSSGYAVYGREILKRLHASGKYQIAEHASYIKSDDPRFNYPWKLYGNAPDNPEEEKRYRHDSPDAFGAFKFEQICLDFQPTHVISFRDIWFDLHIINSPFRKYFRHIFMPAHDSSPSQDAWINDYATADVLMAYQDWSVNELRKCNLNVFGSAPPAASPEFDLLQNKEQIKARLGLPNCKIVGTVMRNQRRKLFPELFRDFKKFTEKHKDVILYCHTSYPESGWDIPALLKEYSLSSQVYFTYICKTCGSVEANPFSDIAMVCRYCHHKSMILPRVEIAVSNEILCAIYNCMDLYVQYSICEGFGIPLVEAAACGVPVCGTNYSAMEDVLPKLGGLPINCHLWREMETNANKALPDSDHFLSLLENYLSLPNFIRESKRMETRQRYLQNYNWDNTAKKWMEAIDSVEPKSWQGDFNYFQPPPMPDHSKWSNQKYVNWLIVNVLQDPSKLGSYFESRMIRDLNYEFKYISFGGTYHNELSLQFAKFHPEPFSRQNAYDECLKLFNHKVYWEQQRKQRFG